MILKTANGDLVQVVPESLAERKRQARRARYVAKKAARLELVEFERARAAERAAACRKLPISGRARERYLAKRDANLAAEVPVRRAP